MQTMRLHGSERHDPDGVPIVALVHNEANILEDFLDHYRRICRPAFLLLDDRSTDGTAEILANAPDVTVFHPVEGTDYRQHQATWRNEILDRHGQGRWCLVPDIDEHFVWAGMESLRFGEYLSQLDAEGAEAVATLMVDMYADMPLRDHLYDRAQDATLASAFPWFDGPAPAPDGYFMRRLRTRSMKSFATPPVRLSGGMRIRLFRSVGRVSRVSAYFLDRLHRLDRPVYASPLERAIEAAFRPVSKKILIGQSTKVGLLRWRKGLSFNAGPHKVNERLRMSESIAAFLHFKFTRGLGGLEYIAERGSHSNQSRGYRDILEHKETLARSPVWKYSRRFEESGCLDGLVRPVPSRTARRSTSS